MQTEDSSMAAEAVVRLAESYKKLLRIDNARYILLQVADDYLNNGLLVEATEAQYGTGVCEYIGHAIRKYYGI